MAALEGAYATTGGFYLIIGPADPALGINQRLKDLPGYGDDPSKVITEDTLYDPANNYEYTGRVKAYQKF